MYTSLTRSHAGMLARSVAVPLVFVFFLGAMPRSAFAGSSVDDLKKQLQQRDLLIRDLLQRVQWLEVQLSRIQKRVWVDGGVGPELAQAGGAQGRRAVQSKRVALPDHELDQIVAGGIPGNIGSVRVSPDHPDDDGLSPFQVAAAVGEAGNLRQQVDKKLQEEVEKKAEQVEVEGAKEGEDERAVTRVPLATVERGGNLLRPGQFQIEPSFSYSNNRSTRLILTGFSIQPLIILGALQSEKVTQNSFNTSVSMRYGLWKDLQADLSIPTSYRMQNRVRLSNERVGFVDDDETDWGLGDISFGMSYQPIYEQGWIPDITTSIRARAPTGRSQFDIFQDVADEGPFVNVENLTRALDDQGLATGSGFWGLTLSTSFVKGLDPAVIFGNIGYTFNFKKRVKLVGVSQEAVDQGVVLVPSVTTAELDPGDSLNFGFGFALALNSRLSVNFSFSNQITFDAKQNGRTVSDSTINSAQFSSGFTLALRPQMSLDVSGSFGLTDDAPDFSLGMSLPMTFNSIKDLVPTAWRSG